MHHRRTTPTAKGVRQVTFVKCRPNLLRFFNDLQTPDDSFNGTDIRIKSPGQRDVLCFAKNNPEVHEHGWCYTQVASLVLKSFNWIDLTGRLLCGGEGEGKS